jgi:hypothetical protein
MPPKGLNDDAGRRPVQINVSLEERAKSNVTSEASNQHLSPTDVFARTRQILDRINSTRQEIQ